MKRRNEKTGASTRLRLAARRDRRLLAEIRREAAERGQAALRSALARPHDSVAASVGQFLADCPAERRTAALRLFLERVVERANSTAVRSACPAPSVRSSAASTCRGGSREEPCATSRSAGASRITRSVTLPRTHFLQPDTPLGPTAIRSAPRTCACSTMDSATSRTTAISDVAEMPSASHAFTTSATPARRTAKAQSQD